MILPIADVQGPHIDYQAVSPLMATAGGSMGLLLGGYVADLRGIPFAWKMAGTLSLLAVPCYLAQRPRPDLAPPRRTLP